MDSTLDKRIAAMRSSLMDTALEAAESRGQRLAGVAHVLYALYRNDGFAGRLLRAHGLESAEIRRLMGTVPNMPLTDGGKPVSNLSTRRILKHANDTLEVLRYLQGNDQVAGLLASHGIGKPDRQPTQAQVLAAAQAGVEAAGPLAPGRDYGMIPATSPAYGSCSRPRSMGRVPDDCRVERKSARINVRRGRVTTRIMNNPTGGDGVLASRHPKTKIRDDGDTFLAGLHESMLGRWRSLCHWRSELSADPVRVFVHWLECETSYAPYGGEANRLYRHMADILERTFLK